MTADGRIRVPADLDAVTAIGREDHSGLDPAAVERIWQAARHWYRAGMHPAIQRMPNGSRSRRRRRSAPTPRPRR
jgi:hypothetical protein